MKDKERIRRQEKPFEGKRKLAAIMFTDIVGYTIMMSKHERKALKVLHNSRNIQKSLIKQFNGEWLKNIGDGMLSSFESAVQAVKCAIKIQRSLKDDPDLRLRIGIHIGDVVFISDDVFGDGVNVASRIKPLAEPGGICISTHVYDKIKNFPDIKALSLGTKELKNVEEPLEVYKVMTEPTLLAEAAKQVFAGQSTATNSIAVLPFTNMSTDQSQEFFCDGITEELINRLTHVKGLRVVARTSSFMFKDKREDIRQIGRKLNVQMLLEGSVRKLGNRLRITAQLINVADGYHLWSEKYDREMEDVFDIQDQVSLAIVDTLKIGLLGGEKTKLLKHHTQDLEAYHLYLKGRYFWGKRTEEDYKKAIHYFKQAIEKDPNYALAYAGLADSYIIIQDYSSMQPKELNTKAKEAAQKALEIDNTLAEAHTSVAQILFRHWDWKGAEREYKRAIELNPNYPTAHHWYALLLVYAARFEEAIEEIEQARKLDTLSLVINRNVALVFFYVRQYDRALDAVKKTLEIDPNFSMTHLTLGTIYLEKSMYEEALKEFQKERSLLGTWDHELESLIGTTYAKMAKKGKARQVLDDLIRRWEQEYASPFYIARVCFSLEETDQGFKWLNKAYKEKDSRLLEIKVDPLFDSVRSNSKFQELLKKVSLEK